MKKYNTVCRELLDVALKVKSETELLELISGLDEQEKKKFFYVFDLRLQKEIVHAMASPTADLFKSIRLMIESSPVLTAYRN